MNRLEKIAHITEEILTEIRDGKRSINSELITFLLDSLDQLKILHSAIEETGTDAVDVQNLPEPPKTKTSKTKKSPKKKKSSAKKPAVAKRRKSKKIASEEFAEDGSWGIFTENLESDKKALAATSAEQGITQDSENTEQKKSGKTGESGGADSQEASKPQLNMMYRSNGTRQTLPSVSMLGCSTTS